MSQSHSTVVVVDDDSDTVEFLCDYLAGMGLDAVSCLPGPEVAASIAQHEPSLVILDMHLGHMTGLDVFHQLRADSTTRLVPVIFFTGSEGEFRQELPDFQALGVALVVKPNIEKLGFLIQRLAHQEA